MGWIKLVNIGGSVAKFIATAFRNTKPDDYTISAWLEELIYEGLLSKGLLKPEQKVKNQGGS